MREVCGATFYETNAFPGSQTNSELLGGSVIARPTETLNEKYLNGRRNL